MLAEEAQNILIEGNRRFVEETSQHPNRCHETRVLTSKRQNPLAVILTCSDSRVSPEIIFDQGIGDLFIVRVAGNILGALELASIEFGVKVLGAQLILVLGHENCGAIQTVLKGKAAQIAPIAKWIDIGENKEEAAATKHHIQHVMKNLKKHFSHVVGAYYHLISGEVEWISKINH